MEDYPHVLAAAPAHVPAAEVFDLAPATLSHLFLVEPGCAAEVLGNPWLTAGLHGGDKMLFVCRRKIDRRKIEGAAHRFARHGFRLYKIDKGGE